MVFVEYPKAMWSPDGEERAVLTAQEEKALRKQGWIDGHEYWQQKAKESVLRKEKK